MLDQTVPGILRRDVRWMNNGRAWGVVVALCFVFGWEGANGSDAEVLGKAFVKSAATNGIILRLYVADVILPGRTDTLALELTVGPNEIQGAFGRHYSPERTCFHLILRDGEGNMAKKTKEGERLLLVLPHEGFQTRHFFAPFASGWSARVERFNLSELFILEEGTAYTLDVQTEVKWLGIPFQPLELLNVPLAIGKNAGKHAMEDAVEIGEVVAHTATSDGIDLRLYIVDEALPRRTDRIALELDASRRKKEEPVFGLMHMPQETFFRLDLRDGEGKPVKRRSVGERLVTSSDSASGTEASPQPIGDRRVERFDLSELFRLEEGKTYTLSVHAEVKRTGGDYQKLELIDVPVRLGKSPP